MSPELTKKTEAEITSSDLSEKLTPEKVATFWAENSKRVSKLEPIIREIANGPLADKDGNNVREVNANRGAISRVVAKLELGDKLRVRLVTKGQNKPVLIGRVK